MASDENENDERHPYEAIEDRADELGLDGDERDDYIERRMQRAGYKKGTGAWVAVSDDDDGDGDHDDDDEPMTRGDWRRMQRERKNRSGGSFTPPRKKKADNEGGEAGKKKKTSGDAWW